MAAATLPLSRTMRVPLSNRQDINEFGMADSASSNNDEWGPSSVPPSSQSNVPWDEQVVPALRKKLEAESKDLSKRISRIEESDNGWARSRESMERRRPVHVSYGQDRRMSREVVKNHQRESSIDQYHNRFASVKTPSRQRAAIATSSFELDSPSDKPMELGGARATAVTQDATARAREKARQIAARQQSKKQQQQQQWNGTTDSAISSYQDAGSSIDAIPESEHVAAGVAGHGSSFERKRLRTQSTPMRPSMDLVDPDAADAAGARWAQNQSSQEPSQLAESPVKGQHHRAKSLSRRKGAAAMDPKLIEEFGPLGSTPSQAAKLLRAHNELDSPSSSPSMRSNRNIQPDAFRSLSPDKISRGYRESSAPPSFGGVRSGELEEFGGSPGSKSVNSWEDQIIPTVARKLQQEQFLKAGKEGRLSRYEGLIDTWDRNGLPLSRSDVLAMQKQQQQQEEEAKKLQEEAEEGARYEQVLTPGPLPAPALQQQRTSNLSPTEGGFDGSRSRASSRRSQRSTYSHNQAQQQWVEDVQLQDLHSQPHLYPPPLQPTPTPAPAIDAAPAPVLPSNGARHDDVDKSGCCCIVM